MSSVACGAPLSLAHVPTDRVLRITGPTAQQLAVNLDPLPERLPVVIRYRAPGAPTSASAAVDEILDQLESVARQLFPTWLPAAQPITTTGDLDRRVVRQLAHEMGGVTTHFGPYLADIAEAALLGCAAKGRFSPEIRARGLAEIIGASYGRDGVVLLVGDTDDYSHDQQVRFALACGWLVDHARFGVWLTSRSLPAVDRFPTWQLGVPDCPQAVAPGASSEVQPPVQYPPLAGLPHPASAAEQALERCLASCAWATGRVWNQTYCSDALTPPIRVDLMWPADRCVVELDGPDHRGAIKYAEDRRRDNGLVLDGVAVLRFTNDEVADDPQRVIGVIERLLSSKRTDEGNLA